MEEEKIRFVDRVKNSVKEREVKKTLVSHWHENKKIYVGIAIGVAAHIVVQSVKKTVPTNVIGIEGNHNDVEINNIGVQHNHAPKRLSYIVTDGDRWWQTQNEAARSIGENETNVSKHLNHGQPLKSGVVLERVGVRS